MLNLLYNQTKRHISEIASAVCLLGLSACATTSPIQSVRSDFVATLPTSWHNTSDRAESLETEALSDWWNRFEDPTLSALIVAALEQNPDVRTALSVIRQARAERGSAEAQLWPSLNGSVGASRSRTDDRENDSTTYSTAYSAGLDASWEVDLFGQQGLLIDAADADLAASLESFHDTQVSLAAEVASTYLSLLSSQAQLRMVKESLSTRETTLQMTQWQEESGEGDVLSTKQSLTSVEQARAQIPELEQSIEEIRNSLAILTGRTPQSFESLPAQATFPEAPDGLAVGIPAETLRQRPDIRKSELSIQAAQARLSAAERERLPSLNLSGSIGVDALSAENLINPERILLSAAAGLSAPLWDGGRIRRNIEIQNEAVVQTYLSYEKTVLNALGEVETALSSIQKVGEQLVILERASDAAGEAVELAQLQYESGEADLLTVLETQRTELSLDQNKISTQAQLLTAYVQLYKALGGGWSAPQNMAKL